jgi:hypothetical protein
MLHSALSRQPPRRSAVTIIGIELIPIPLHVSFSIRLTPSAAGGWTERIIPSH